MIAAAIPFGREDPPPVVSAAEHRAGMARLAAGVSIVTSLDGALPCGFTASAICSVTDMPATLLVCVNRSVTSRPAIEASRMLCVNTVSHFHEELSRRFADTKIPMASRFSTGDWTVLVTGAPVLVGAAASFDCRVAQVTLCGSHDVLFCEVLGIAISETPGGLVYLNRCFHGLP